MQQKELNRVATPETLAYIRQLIGYKRTHIENETKRLNYLEELEKELERAK